MPLYKLTEAQAAEVRHILKHWTPPDLDRQWRRRCRVVEAAYKNLLEPVKSSRKLMQQAAEELGRAWDA